MFFRFDNENIIETKNFKKVLDQYSIEIFSPTLFQLKKHSAKIWIYIFWFIFTKGQYKIIYVKKDDKLIHYSHTLPKFFKFPFMGSEDLEVGPSWTDEKYRGKGIFPAVIGYTVQLFKKEKCTFYILVHKDNSSSQKAVLKSGFNKWRDGYKTEKLGIYRIKDNE